MANTLTITRAHLDKDNYYIGPDVSNFDGDIELDAHLGLVKFKTSLSASGSIVAKRETGIKADGGIKAGESIEASGFIKSEKYIKAGTYIQSEWDIQAGEYVKAGTYIQAETYIQAGESIHAGWGIEAGECVLAKQSIEAGHSIEAGDVIKAGKWIRAGLSIDCKTLFAGLPIFAGTTTRIKPDSANTQIRCEKLYGKVAHGDLVLKGEQEAGE